MHHSILVALMLCGMLFSCVRDLHEQVELPEPPCAEEACACADGFEGPGCNQRVVHKFVGIYPKGEASCLEDQWPVGSHRISESPKGLEYIEIHDGLHQQPILARVDGWNFSIPLQKNHLKDAASGGFVSQEVEGIGWLDLERGKLVYQLYNRKCQVELAL